MQELMKFWEGGEVLREPVCFARMPDGTLTGGTLLYTPTRIVSVTSHDGSVTYEPGRDYTLTGRTLSLTPDSRIPVLEREIYCKPYDGTPERAWLRLPGGAEYLEIYPWVYRWQILVSYTHADTWQDVTPAADTAALPRTMEKLAQGGEYRLMFYGDSITAGWEASGCDEEVIDVRTAKPFHLKLDRWPHLPAWPELVTGELRRAFPGAEIVKANRGAGGSTTAWGVEHAAELVNDFRPDLTVVAFGMNGPCDPPEEHRAQIEAILDIIRDANPACEFLMVSAMVPSDELAAYQGNTLGAMEQALYEIAAARPGVTVAPVHRMFEAVRRAGKSYYEITGNCINHPNDFSVRVYAQTILSVLGR